MPCFDLTSGAGADRIDGFADGCSTAGSFSAVEEFSGGAAAHVADFLSSVCNPAPAITNAMMTQLAMRFAEGLGHVP
jgi:hypothetical protein